MRNFFCLLLVCLIPVLSFAEISLSLGSTYGKYVQQLSQNGDTWARESVLSGRPALFYELDSANHSLWLPNDQVIYGIAAFSETRHHDYVEIYNHTLYIPLYANYYLNFNNWAVGAGINFNLMQLRYRNNASFISQQLGKNFLIRYKPNPDYFFELGIMDTADSTVYNDILSLYYATNYFLRVGWYIEQNKL